jgi:hypothetical protein
MPVDEIIQYHPGRAPCHIPAMTTDAERWCYYRLAREAAGKGAIVELGAWLGASTLFIAEGIRDSGVAQKVFVHDKFLSKPGHERKVREFYDRQGGDIPQGPCLEQFKANLGPLMDYVKVRKGQIEEMEWGGEPIALLVTDAPKRVPAISPVLTTLRTALQPGAIMAWQDFCHFPSYEIPACLYRLREHLEFVEAVVPGTTLVFQVKSQWAQAEVSLANLALTRWTPAEIAEAWEYWAEFVPAEKAALFQCGQAMFLCDIGRPREAKVALAPVMRDEAVAKKWEYLRKNRPDFVTRYWPLFELIRLAA